jgi:hypothetical protein
MKIHGGRDLRLAFVALLLSIFFCGQGLAQIDNASRLNELRGLRDQLTNSRGLRDADVVVVLNEKLLAEAARRLIGLETVLSNGSLINVTSVECELKTAAALVKIGLQAKSSVTVNLQLIGRINSGELRKDSLRLPIRVTDVKLGNGLFSSALIKTMFGKWLKPDTWNDELPGIDLPLSIADSLEIPASRFETTGETPMEIATPAYTLPIKISLASVLILNKRAAIALRINDGAPSTVAELPPPIAIQENVAALETEIEALSQHLSSDGDLRIRLGRRAIEQLLTQLAGAQTTDFDIRLKPGRLRSEEATAIIKVTNFTDIEGGQGRADVTGLNIDRIADNKVSVKLNGQGELDARLRGREYGIPYNFSPHVNFSITDRILPFEIANDDKGPFLRATPGASFPIDLRISSPMLGTEFSVSRSVDVQADRWLNRIDLPSPAGRQLPLPKKLEIDAEGNLRIVRSEKLTYTLGNFRLAAVEDAVDIEADVKLQ